MVQNKDFEQIIEALAPNEEQDNLWAYTFNSPCRIYFNNWYFPVSYEHVFAEILTHELGHAWNIDHSKNPRSRFYYLYSPGQIVTASDRFALWIARQSRKLNSTINGGHIK
jgi:hypothetical protein